MAIAFDAASAHENYSAGTTATQSHTVTGSNTILIVCTHQLSGSDNVSGVTYNGVAMTKIGSTVTIQASTAYMALWYLLNPSTGTNNIVATKTSGENVSIAAASYTGVNQSGQPEVSGTSTGSGTSLSRSITSTSDNAWDIMVVGGNGTGGTDSGTTNWTRRANTFTKGSLGDVGPVTPAGATTQTVTFSASQSWGLIQISIGVYSASGPTNLKSLDTNVKANIKSYNTNVIANVKSVNTNS